MSAKTIIKQVLIEKNMTAKDLADKLGILPSSMRNKMYRDNFTFNETLAILDMLGADIKVVMRDSKKEFSV